MQLTLGCARDAMALVRGGAHGEARDVSGACARSHWCLGSRAETSQERLAEPPYVPIPRAQPAELRMLPSFGTIEWTAAELPWVAPGPEAGISGMGLAAEEGQLYLAGGFIPGGDGSADRSRRTALAARRYDIRTG